MKKESITKQEFSMFAEKIAQTFELEILNTQSTVSCDDIQGIEGVVFKRFNKADKVEAISLDDMAIGSVNFYSKTNKHAVFYLIKHFRNCSSHNNRIFHSTIGGDKVIVFEDTHNGCATMRAIIKADRWNTTFEKIIQEYKIKIVRSINSNNNENNYS